MKSKTKVLKKVIIPILVLVLCLVPSFAVSAADSYIEGQKYTYNGTEYGLKGRRTQPSQRMFTTSAEQPEATQTTAQQRKRLLQR